MNLPPNLVRLFGALALAVPVAAALGATVSTTACTSSPTAPAADDELEEEDDDAGDPGPKADAALAPDAVLLIILPGALYSGFDGTHEFKVPVAVHGAKGVTLTASDNTVVDIAKSQLTDPAEAAKDDGERFMLTVKKVGSITLTATVPGARATATLDVASYAANRYAVGENRYMNGGGTGQPACIQCHAEGSGKDHSPTKVAASPDNEVMAIITTGILRGTPIRGVNHRWEVDEPTLDGLVTYLRALPPRGYAGRN